jgi:hypothetical protein
MRYNINNSDDIRKAIGLLEDEVEEQKQLMMEQVNILYDSFSPVNVVKDVFREVVTSEEFRSNILTAALGISTGYVTKRLLFKKSNNPLKAITGNLLQYGIANMIANPSRVLKTIFLPLLEFFSARKEKEPQNS